MKFFFLTGICITGGEEVDIMDELLDSVEQYDELGAPGSDGTCIFFLLILF